MEDPLESYSGLALFPQTLGHRHPPSTTDRLSIHSFLKSLPMSAPDNLVQQGRSILETASEITEKPPQQEAEKTELVASPPRRRKGLERKRERPRFSLIPNANISSVNLEPEMDYDNPKFKDPEEFFLAYDRHENAKREIAKHMGRVSEDFSQNNGSTMAPRTRRPGIPGFRRSKAAKYRHLYPTVSSQESIVEDILSPSNHGLQNESVNQDVVLQENEVVAPQQGEPGNNAAEDMELAGSVLQAEDRIDKLLDELLAHDVDDLDGDGALNLLKDRLQIKSLEIGKLNFPAQRIDLKAPGTNVSKPMDASSDVHNLLDGRSESPMKQKGTGSFTHSLCSPITPKSPFPSLSVLKERLAQSNPSYDPFSTANIDESPAQNTSPFENIKKSSDPIDTEKELIISSPLKPITTEHEVPSSKDKIADMTTGGTDQNLVQSDTFADARTTGPNAMEDLVKSIQQEAASTSQPGPDDIHESLSHLDTDADFQTEGSTGLEDMERNVEHEAVDSSLPCSMTWISTENQFEQSDYPMDGCFEIQDDAPQQIKDISPKQIQKTVSEIHNEKNKEPSVVSKEGQVKAKSQSRKKKLSRRQQKNEEHSVVSKEGQVKARSQSRNKELSRRQSLAAAGTAWNSEGVRRSTRIRSRPLEYWRGERFLYGRIHESLATVIGIKKYQTPKKGRKNGNDDMVVESFVSDKYQNLVKLAALQ